jgi:hypothetical protein
MANTIGVKTLTTIGDKITSGIHAALYHIYSVTTHQAVKMLILFTQFCAFLLAINICAAATLSDDQKKVCFHPNFLKFYLNSWLRQNFVQICHGYEGNFLSAYQFDALRTNTTISLLFFETKSTIFKHTIFIQN